MVFIPTYLYIKQHIKTGKLYFGKTTKRDPLKYTGSGKRWKSHINFYGEEYVVTLWYQLYDNVFDLVADAISMSHSLDIVVSDSWMNLKIETGLDGGNGGGYKLTTSHKQKIGMSNSIRPRRQEELDRLAYYSRNKSKESLEKHREKMIGRKLSEDHKNSISKSLSGKKKSKSHIENARVALINSKNRVILRDEFHPNSQEIYVDWVRYPSIYSAILGSGISEYTMTKYNKMLDEIISKFNDDFNNSYIIE